MLVREQPLRAGLRHDAVEEGLGNVPGQQAFAVLGEDRGVPDRIVHGQAHEPPKQEVVVELLHQQPLAPDRVEHLKQQGPEQLLRGNGRPARPGVEAGKPGGQLGQDPIDHLADQPERMLLGHSSLGRDVAPHGVLYPVVAAHAHLLATHESRMPMTQIPSFSASC